MNQYETKQLQQKLSVLNKGSERDYYISTLFNKEQSKKDEGEDETKLKLLVNISNPDKFNPINFAEELLSTLMRNPEFGLNWSKHFGRTGVVYSTSKKNQIILTTYNSSMDKNGLNISTLPSYSFKDMTGKQDVEKNVIKLFPTDQKLGLEGIARQITGLVDEAIYSIFEKLNVLYPNISELENYKIALKICLNYGFQIISKNETKILSQSFIQQDYKVRLYGNINKSDIVPRVMGGVDISCVNFTEYFTYLNETSDLENIDQLQNLEVEEVKYREMLPSENILREARMVIGITVTKQPHIGHLLSAARANQISNILQGQVVVLANDYAPRISETIVYYCFSNKISPMLCLKNLISGQVDLSKLDDAYKNRNNNKEMSVSMYRLLIRQVDAQMEKLRGENLNPIQPAIDRLESLFKQAGLTSTIVSTSQANKEFKAEEYVDKNYVGTGFGPVSYLNSKGNKQQTVILNANKLTSVGSALALNQFLSDKDRLPKPIVYVDLESSNQVGLNLIQTKYKIPSQMISGFGIKFDGQQSQGSLGNTLNFEECFSIISNDISKSKLTLIELANYFLSERYFVKNNSTGEQIYNYNTKESLMYDIFTIAEQLRSFKLQIKGVLELPTQDEAETNSLQKYDTIKNKTVSNVSEIFTSTNYKDKNVGMLLTEIKNKFIDDKYEKAFLEVILPRLLNSNIRLIDLLEKLSQEKMLKPKETLFQGFSNPNDQLLFLRELSTRLNPPYNLQKESLLEEAISCGKITRFKVLEYFYYKNILSNSTAKLFESRDLTVLSFIKQYGFSSETGLELAKQIILGETNFVCTKYKPMEILKSLVEEAELAKFSSYRRNLAIKDLCQLNNIAI